MRILYFALLRERIGLAEETVSPPAEIRTVAELVAWLRGRSPRSLAALAREASAQGVGVYPITPHYVHPPARAGLLFGYSALNERDIRTGISRLARLLA